MTPRSVISPATRRAGKGEIYALCGCSQCQRCVNHRNTRMSITVSREPRRDRRFCIDHVQRWKRSELRKADYCEKHRIKAGSFYKCSSKIFTTNPNDVDTLLDLTPALPNFLPVKVTASTWSSSSAQFVHVERFVRTYLPHLLLLEARYFACDWRDGAGNRGLGAVWQRIGKIRRIVVDMDQE